MAKSIRLFSSVGFNGQQNFHTLKQLLRAVGSGVVSLNPPAASTAGGRSFLWTAAVWSISGTMVDFHSKNVSKLRFFFLMQKTVSG